MPLAFSKLTWAVALPAALLSVSCLAAPAIKVTLAHGSADEKTTQAQLARLMSQHDLTKWVRTRQVVISAGEIPHSHPVLTLHTRHLDRDDLLLSTFVHEQIHWHVDMKPAAMAAAVADLRVLYPVLPVGYPKGANDEAGSYEHLVIIYLEDQANRELHGMGAARKIMQHWSGDHYTELVKIVVRDNRKIMRVVQKHGLYVEETLM